jgi:hypothetical protein
MPTTHTHTLSSAGQPSKSRYPADNNISTGRRVAGRNGSPVGHLASPVVDGDVYSMGVLPADDVLIPDRVISLIACATIDAIFSTVC